MDYRLAIEQAIIYIEDMLGEAIKVEDVARAAGYSYYHLNRQFTTILGESIGSYIRMRRLANAAKALLYSNKRIIDVALDNGFESPSLLAARLNSYIRSARRNTVSIDWTPSLLPRLNCTLIYWSI